MNNFKDTLTKIKTRGYWRVIVEPVFPTEHFFNHIIDAKTFVSEKRVTLRGRDYPHVPEKKDENENFEMLSDRINSFTDWNHFQECWTYFQSGQFVHVVGLCEDWFCDSDWFEKDHFLRQVKPLTVLDFVWATHSITEMFIFIKNIANDERYKGQIKVKISLHNTMNRGLTIFDTRRIAIYSERKSTAKELIGIERKISTDELNQNYLQIAKDTTVNIIKYFDWADPPVKVIEDDQQKLINRKL